MAQPSIASAAFSKAQLAHKAGQLDAAQHGYQLALQADPNFAEAWHMLGVVRGQVGDSTTSVQYIKKAISLQPRNPKALYNLGRVYHDSGASNDAILAYTQAVRLDTSHGAAWNNLGTLFLDVEHYDAAIAAFESGIRADAQYEPLHDNLCRQYKRRNDLQACLKSADRGIQSLPESSRLWIHRSEVCFALGQFEDAWDAYEWRFKSPENPNTAPSYPIKPWHGENLQDKSLLVWTEQGPGETFLFSSLLEDIISQAKKCVLVTTARLCPILTRAFPEVEVLDGEQSTFTSDSADFQVSLISSGRWLRKAWPDFPVPRPRIKAAPALQNKYAKAIRPQADDRPVVGIAWRSMGVPTADEKSILLDAWRPILSVPGIKFVSLQYGDMTQELSELEAATGLSITQQRDLDPVTDLDSHLALVANMDLVISSSNTTVHAAAAQGVPVWCMVNHTLGEGLRWPWFVDRSDSPWYPSLTLYRQEKRNDWTAPIARVAVDLASWRAQQNKEHDDGFVLSGHLVALALAYHKAGLTKAAGLAAEAALQENDTSPEMYRLAAHGCSARDQAKDAIKVLDQGLIEHPTNMDILIDRAAALLADGQIKSAETDLRKALAKTPNSVEALNNLARLLARQGYSQNALDLFQKADAQRPGNAIIQLAIASRLYELGRMEDCKALLERLMQDQAPAAAAASHLGIALLLHGAYADGWRYLRHRLSQPTESISYQHFPFPAWTGDSVKDKHVLVWTEQGIGDEILLTTMMGDLGRQTKSITLLCSSRLVPLFKRSLHRVRVAVRDEPLPKEAVDPKIDVQMSFSDVGLLTRPSLDSFPDAPKNQVLKADPRARRAFRKKYLQSFPDSVLVGISWHSTTRDFGEAKSIPPELFVDLIRSVPARFVSLQYGPSPSHLETLQAAAPSRWIHDDSVDPLVDMDLAAAQVAAMDFVITISNTTAHTAGALGVSTALLVPPQGGRHWYWTKNQERSAWYPSVTVYEANEPQAWHDPIKRVAENLRELIPMS